MGEYARPRGGKPPNLAAIAQEPDTRGQHVQLMLMNARGMSAVAMLTVLTH